VRDLTKVSEVVEPDGVADAAAVTRIFQLAHGQAKRTEAVVRPFLVGQGANVVSLDEQGIVIITDYASNLKRLARMVELVDQPGAAIETRYVKLEHLEASAMANQVNQYLSAKQRAGAIPGAGGQQKSLEILQDARTNQLVIIGEAEQVTEAAEYIDRFDIPMDRQTRIYALETAKPERLDRLTRELIGELQAKQSYKSAIDQEGNLLIVTATPEIHVTVASLKDDLDVAALQEANPIRFYKLINTKAADVLATIQAIEGGQGFASMSVEGGAPQPARQPRESFAGPNRPQGATGEALPTPPGYRAPPEVAPEATRDVAGTDQGTAATPVIGTLTMPTVQTDRARVTADVNTNTIIVAADRATHRIYEDLIQRLDKRRPQVLIEATIVALDTSGGYSLGVEILRAGELDDEGRYLTFSSFGLSEDVDPADARLVLSPGIGFNGAIVSMDIADVVIKALKTSGRAKVVSAPRILVKDNATGTLESINEAPFTSVNASDTVATTSFAGFVSAGTTINMTPHISEGDHLHLEYSIALNSFDGGGSDGVPPPRQTNSLSSEITVPDGHTVIIGGLNRTDLGETIQRVPILGEIPVLEYLFSNRSENESETTLFVFLRPAILRDDRFEDLKYLSSRDLTRAGIPGDFPSSEPMMVD